MAKQVTIAIIVGVAIVAGIIGFQAYEMSWQKTSTEDYYDKDCTSGCEGVSHVVYPENPQFFYGLKINKDKYLLGENIYVSITNIPKELKTQALFFTPYGTQFYEIQIDGEKNSFIKEYFRPQLLMNRNVCDVEELKGEWTVSFMNLPAEALKFQVMDEYLPGNEIYYTGEDFQCGKKNYDFTLDPSYIPPEQRLAVTPP